jgi:hypothetical protein
LTFGPGLFQDGMFSPHLYLNRFVFLVYEITRHIAIAMQQVVVEKPLEEEETVLQDGNIETGVAESKDNFLG